MVKVELYNGVDWHLSRKTKHNLDILINDLANSEMDILLILDGHEGTGKSFMSRGIGRYIATKLRKFFPKTKFDVDDITFDTATYVNQSLDHGNPFKKEAVKINVLDEGRHALNRKSSTSRGNKVFTNFLSECRAMQQVHIILAPAFHDLDKNVVLWRTSAILHSEKTYTQDKDSDTGFKLKRGNFKLFTSKNDIATKYMFPYQYPKFFQDFSTWSNKEVFSPEELEGYNEKKFKATLQKYQVDKEVNETENAILPADALVRASIVSKELGIKSLAIRRMVERGELKGRKIANRWYVEKFDVLEKTGLNFGVKRVD